MTIDYDKLMKVFREASKIEGKKEKPKPKK